MPACFRLFPKGSDTPARLVAVDDAMCQHFGVPPDPVHYYRGWFDIEGLMLALGRDWDYMRANFPDRAPIVDWLEANYTSDAWTEIGRR